MSGLSAASCTPRRQPAQHVGPTSGPLKQASTLLLGVLVILLPDLALADLALAPVSACAPVVLGTNGHVKRGLVPLVLVIDPLLVSVHRTSLGSSARWKLWYLTSALVGNRRSRGLLRLSALLLPFPPAALVTPPLLPAATLPESEVFALTDAVF